jgi:hypothetical protein
MVCLVLLCQRSVALFAREQHGHRGTVLSKVAAIRSRKSVKSGGGAARAGAREAAMREQDRFFVGCGVLAGTVRAS